MEKLKIILYTCVLLLHTAGLIGALALLGMMCYRWSTIRTNRTSYLLIANGYIDLLLTCPLFIEMSIKSIYGQLYPKSDFNGKSCIAKAFISHMTGCVYFYSFLLQAIYRFCRIVHPRKARFQSFRCYASMSVMQWILAFVVLLPNLLRGDIEYMPEEYHCQFALTNVQGSMIGLAGLFLIPVASTLGCYIYTLHYIRRKSTALITIDQQLRTRRDLRIFSHLMILLTFVSMTGLPHLIMSIVYAITGYSPPWAIAFVWVLTFISFFTSSIVQLFVSPHLRTLFTSPSILYFRQNQYLNHMS
jgi:hypothetical protein